MADEVYWKARTHLSDALKALADAPRKTDDVREAALEAARAANELTDSLVAVAAQGFGDDTVVTVDAVEDELEGVRAAVATLIEAS